MIRRQRDDGRLGTPDFHWCAKWGSYCEERGIFDQPGVYEILDAAKRGADAREAWRRWRFLDLQVQLAAERYVPRSPAGPTATDPAPPEDETTEWACVKQELRTQISPTGFENWLAETRQLDRAGSVLRVSVDDEFTAAWLTEEYGSVIDGILPAFDIANVEWVFRSEVLQTQISERAGWFASAIRQRG